MLDLQTIFNRSVLGLIAQGAPATGPFGNCLYHTDSGNKCALGLLIPDEHYLPAAEGSIAEYEPDPEFRMSSPIYRMCKASGIDLGSRAVAALVEDLQSMHDTFSLNGLERNSTFVEYLKFTSPGIATKHGLTPIAV